MDASRLIMHSDWNFRETFPSIYPSIHPRSDILVVETIRNSLVWAAVGCINENECITEFLGTENEACDVDQLVSDV